MFGERADAEINIRKIKALSGAQLPADDDTTVDIISCNAAHLELNKTIVKEERITGLDGQRKTGKGG